MNTPDTQGLKPATSYTDVPLDGEPFLRGARCARCGAVYLGDRQDCGRCLTLGEMAPIRLGKTGKLYNYTIVYRSYPHIKVPFISAIVDLDDGGTVKGNLLDIEPDPTHLAFGMPVRMVFRPAAIASAEGAGHLAHFFVPA